MVETTNKRKMSTLVKSFSMTEREEDLISKLAQFHGIQKSALIRTLVLREARKLGLLINKL